MPLWRDSHWLAFDNKVACSSVGALAAQPPISLLSSHHTQDVVPQSPNKTLSTRVQHRSSMNLLIFVCALVYLAEHMLGSLQYLPQNTLLSFALCNGNDAHSF